MAERAVSIRPYDLLTGKRQRFEHRLIVCIYLHCRLIH